MELASRDVISRAEQTEIDEGRGFCVYVLVDLDLLVFFFQAEDGIRDADVTGVQTCALPISHRNRLGEIRIADDHCDGAAADRIAEHHEACRKPAKIGRASCRERV